MNYWKLHLSAYELPPSAGRVAGNNLPPVRHDQLRVSNSNVGKMDPTWSRWLTYI